MTRRKDTTFYKTKQVIEQRTRNEATNLIDANRQITGQLEDNAWSIFEGIKKLIEDFFCIEILSVKAY